MTSKAIAVLIDWILLTRLGDATLMLPLAALLLSGLLVLQAGSLAAQWGWRFLLAVVLTLVSKIAFFGWGVGSAALDFTGFSGHTLLATAILPLLTGWAFAGKYRYQGLLPGLIMAVLVGISRLKLGAHSDSEVVSGWLLGLWVILPLIQPGFAAYPRLKQRGRLIPLGIMALTAGVLYLPPWSLPSFQWEQQFARWVAGREQVYTRLHFQPGQPLLD